MEDAEAALADFSTAIELDPSLTSAYSSRAHILSQQDDAKAALADYTSLIEQIRKRFRLLRQGNAHREAGDVEAALADFTRAIEIDPGSSTPSAAGRTMPTAANTHWLLPIDEAVLELRPTARQLMPGAGALTPNSATSSWRLTA